MSSATPRAVAVEIAPDLNNTIQINEPIHNYEDFENLPVGTQVTPVATYDGRRPWIKQAGGLWRQDNMTRAADQLFALGSHQVSTYPAGYRPSPALGLTLHQHKFQFRDWAFAAQELNGVSFEAVNGVMHELGCEAEAFPPGPGLVIESVYDRSLLPHDTIVRVGEPTNERFGIFLFDSNRHFWRPLLGSMRALDRQFKSVIESIPGMDTPPEWITAKATGADADAILQFKRRAWVVSDKVRRNQNWCGTFNTAVKRMGLSEAVLRVTSAGAVTLGQFVTTEQARMLPMGSVLRWRHRTTPETCVVWYRRVERSSNAAGTGRIFGYRNDGQSLGHYSSSSSMEVMYLPSDPIGSLGLDVDIEHALPHLPPGTRLAYEGTTETYMVCPDHTIHAWREGRIPGHGSYSLGDFRRGDGDYGITVYSFGEVQS